MFYNIDIYPYVEINSDNSDTNNKFFSNIHCLHTSGMFSNTNNSYDQLEQSNIADYILKHNDLYITPEFMQARGEYIVPHVTLLNMAPATASVLWLYGRYNVVFDDKWVLDFTKYQFPQLTNITISENCCNWIKNVVFTSMYPSSMSFQLLY